jgi:hypothetical protein
LLDFLGEGSDLVEVSDLLEVSALPEDSALVSFLDEDSSFDELSLFASELFESELCESEPLESESLDPLSPLEPESPFAEDPDPFLA